MSIYRGRVVRPKPINIKPFPIPKRKFSRRLSRPTVCAMKGGPMHGGFRYTRTFVETLVITLKGQTGVYLCSGEWIPCNEKGEHLYTREQVHAKDKNHV